MAGTKARTNAKAPSNKRSHVAQTQRHRTSATERHYIAGYPSKLFIYKSNASPYWWVRYFAFGNAVRKSTKTTSKLEATRFAKDFFATITNNIQTGIQSSRNMYSFISCYEQLIEEDKAKYERGELTKISLDNNIYRLKKSILPFFANMDVRDLNYQVFTGYLNKISKEDLSTETIAAYMRLVKRVLTNAARRGVLSSVPEFPVVSIEDKPRGWFNTREYRQLWSRAKILAGKKYQIRRYIDEDGQKATQYIDELAPVKERLGEFERNVQMTEDFRRLIVFIANSYIRPTDIKYMQHKHVAIVKTDEYDYLRLTIPPSKGHSSPIITMPGAVRTYLKLREFQLEDGKISSNYNEDYVFLPQIKGRDYALKLLQRQWNVLVNILGMGVDAYGNERTLYSLRHTAIMYRLIFGDNVNTLLLARNARTSVEMIDRFYAAPLSGEMNVDSLVSKKRKRHYFDGD